MSSVSESDAHTPHVRRCAAHALVGSARPRCSRTTAVCAVHSPGVCGVVKRSLVRTLAAALPIEPPIAFTGIYVPVLRRDCLHAHQR